MVYTLLFLLLVEIGIICTKNVVNTCKYTKENGQNMLIWQYAPTIIKYASIYP